jgi:hypothetical protein
LMATEAQPQAKETEKLTLLVAESSSGYFGVNIKHGQAKPYQARVWRGGKLVHLGSFATAEEAALCVARSPEGRTAAAERAAAAEPLTSEEARQQAQAEKLTLLVTNNKVGYFGVHLGNPVASPSPIRRGCGAVARKCTWASSPRPRRRRCASRDRRRGGRRRRSGLQRRSR